ncbi:MAG TPA: hypothetical protein VF857_01955 [Spirochaetota bacterium]
MKKLSEAEVRKAIDAIHTEEEAVAVMSAFAENQPELAAYIDASCENFTRTEKFFLMTSASTIWHIITSASGPVPTITRASIGKIVADLDTEFRPFFVDQGDDPLKSIQSIIAHSSQGELLLSLIGILLAGAEENTTGEDALRDEMMQSLFYRLLVIIEVISRSESVAQVH